MNHQTSNDKLEKATVSVREMEKHMNTALLWMTEAIRDRCEESERVEKENELLREQNKQLKNLMELMWLLNLGLYVVGVGAGWYVCS